jgi:hypothetical protein
MEQAIIDFLKYAILVYLLRMYGYIDRRYCLCLR